MAEMKPAVPGKWLYGRVIVLALLLSLLVGIGIISADISMVVGEVIASVVRGYVQHALGL